MNSNILKANNIKKIFKNKLVVNDVSLTIKNGQIVGLLGPNGAGKTTIFYIVLGIISSNFGEIYINNNNITKLPIHKRALLGLGYLPQEPSVFRKLTVIENIYAILELTNLKKKDRNNRLEELLYALNIYDIRNNKTISLSGGERRRVEIARTLAINPKFILLDEPFAGVDPLSINEIKKIIVFLKEQNIGVLITDHNVRETFSICDYSYIINKGELLAKGHPQDLINNNEVKKVYLGESFTLN